MLAQITATLSAAPTWVIAVGVATLLWWLFTADWCQSNLPPRFPILWRLITGQFTLKKDGALAIVQVRSRAPNFYYRPLF